MKYQVIIFLFISLFKKYKLFDDPDLYKELCNIQIPGEKSHCQNLFYKNGTIESPISSKACCFERFRINKIVTTRCVYLDNTEDGLRDEKKYLKEEWGVKNLTILCSGGNLKFNYFLLLILEILLFVI